MSGAESIIYRVSAGECLAPQSVRGWGEILVPATDPDVVARPWEGVRCALPSRLPADAWQAWLSLAWELCGDGSGERDEVGVIILRSAAEPHERWRVCVPRQAVGTGALTYDLDEMRDILTGELLRGVPDGWLHVGSAHSHHTMSAFFSAADDRDELGVPGAHIVIGDVDKSRNTYRYRASIVHARARHAVELEDVVVTGGGSVATHHPSVLGLVTRGQSVTYQLDVGRETSRVASPYRDIDWAALMSDDRESDDRESLRDWYLTELEDIVSELDSEGIRRAFDLLANREADLADADADAGVLE